MQILTTNQNHDTISPYPGGWNPRYSLQIADIIIQFFHFIVKESLGRVMGTGSGAPSHWESTGAINQFSGGFQPDPCREKNYYILKD